MLSNDAEHLLIKRLEDLHKAANKRRQCTNTEFLAMAEGSVAMAYLDSHNITYLMSGGYNEADRQLALIFPDDALDAAIHTLPINFIQIKPSGNRFHGDPTHRDYLGALMNLGIERRVFGDMIIQEQMCTLICINHIREFIMTNLNHVGNCDVHLEVIDSLEDLQVQRQYKRIRNTVASLRLDSIVKICTNLSRGSSMSLIKSGSVFVDGREINKASHLVEEGRVLSIRGYGKYRVAFIGSKTKKDRTVVEIDQYI